jgi:thiosulfate dehydrogenase
MRTKLLTALSASLTAVAIYIGWQMLMPDERTAQASDWLAREVTACDKRKTVIVEGARPDQPLPPEKARQVANLLQDLMRFCTEEVKARLTTEEEIFLSVNGLPYQRYVLGSPLPYLPVHGKPHSQREMQIWQAEYQRMVDEGNKLFHDSSLGKNGISCDMCHPNAANTHPETYPKFQTQLKSVALLRDMVNWCLENPLEGEKLADNDPKMKALEAYILHQRRGVALEAGKH